MRTFGLRAVWIVAALVVSSSVACSRFESSEHSKGAGSATVIRNVILIDGTGAKARRADVRFEHGRIAEVGEVKTNSAGQIIDGEGLVLAPGFIDTHSHHDEGLFESPDLLPVVSQGITTIIVGQDGFSNYPLRDFYRRIEGSPIAANLGSYTGHNSLRDNALADNGKRVATAIEIEAMKGMLRADMEEGSFGVSTGLEYDTGIYSSGSEVMALARVSAEMNGRYISHLRSEDVRLDEAIDEIIAIGRETGQPVKISHLKIAWLQKWGAAAEILQKLENARAAGVDITADVYPYDFWQSTIRVLIPDRDFTDRDAVSFALTNLVSPEDLVLTAFLPRPDLVGQNIRQIAAGRGVDPVTAYIDLVAMLDDYESRADGAQDVEAVIGYSMSERDVASFLKWPHSNLCSDGSLASGHPRGFGAFPRFLGLYVREKQMLRLEEAIYKVTGLAASHLGIKNRGAIAEGFYADLVLFDPARIRDNATIDHPHEMSTGIESVWVNGAPVYGRYTPRDKAMKPGMLIRRGE